MGIVGSTQLVAMATEACHVARVRRWRDHYLNLLPEAAENYISEHEAWWCRLLATWGFHDRLLGAIAAKEERRQHAD